MIQFDDSEREKKLAELHEQEEEQLAQILSRKYGVEYVDLTRVSIDTDALRLIPEDVAKKAYIAAFRKTGKKVFLAVRSPARPEVKEQIEQLKRLGYESRVFMVSTNSLKHAWSHYKDISHASASEAGMLNIAVEEIQNIQNNIKTLPDLIAHFEEIISGKGTHKVSRLLEAILGGGLALGVSDVHLEPEEEFIRIRFRIDGVLTNIIEINEATYKLLLSRIKLLSGMKLNIRNEAQDGRFSVNVGNREIEIRSSIIPGAYGETVVMRLLDPETIGLSLNDLGFDDFTLNIFKHEIAKPNGMILNTGPTGSGKTTTLYAFLKYIFKPEIKIITLENPVEYHLEGVVQTQISKNYSFAQGLRAILRQDPDIIMVGEIRDPEVAEVAVHAALTGHLVFSTLHTNNAAGTFPRLIDLGVRPETLSASLNITMAQRLARKLCNHCKRPVAILGDEKRLIDLILNFMPRREELGEIPNQIFEAVGCEKCNYTGYKGRVAIVEAIQMDPKVEAVVRKNPSEIEIWKAARHQRIRRMYEDGLVKVLAGITSFDELKRVVDINEEEILAIANSGPRQELAKNENSDIKESSNGSGYKKPISYGENSSANYGIS